MARPAPSRRVLPFLLLLLLLLVLLHSISVYGHGGGHDDDDDADAGGAEAGPPPNLRARPLVLVKIWCLILVFVGTFAGGVSPYFFKWNEAFLVLGTQFAGGVFFGTALMHFLSDAAEKFGDLTKKEYPFAFMLASAGYLLTMLVDCAISGVVGRQGVHGSGMGAAGAGDAADGGSSQKNRSDGGYSRTHAEAEEQKLDHVNHPLENASSLGDTILLIVALCFHSVFEGIAIGVAKTKADAWRALWTVSLHKIFAAIAMGIALLRMIPDRPFLSCVAYAFAFAISSPIGVAIGIIIDATTQGHVADWIYAISMGIACGVFIYVCINHLLAKGYKSKEPLVADTPFNRWLAVVLGVAVIAVVMIWD